MAIDPVYDVPVRVTSVFDDKIPTKRRGVAVRQMQKATLRLNLLTDLGQPADLTVYGISTGTPSSRVQVHFREITEIGHRPDPEPQQGTIEALCPAVITFPLGADLTQDSGVYICEIGIFDNTEHLCFSNVLTILVERGLFAPIREFPGQPTMDELRLTLKDNGPEDNRLLDDFEFDPAEIGHAIYRCVQFWNTCQPPIQVFYDTINYPFRDMWITGCCGLLMKMAAHRYLRNDLQYSAGGVQVQDQAKASPYMEIGTGLWQEYTTMVKQKKVDFNAQAAFGTLRSPHSALQRYRYNGRYGG